MAGSKEELNMRINLFCLLCLLFSACSNENPVLPSSGNGEECVFQFMLRVPGTIDVETKGGETKADGPLKLGETIVHNVWILQFSEDGSSLLKAVFADKSNIQPVSSSNKFDQLLIQLTKEGMLFKNEKSKFYIIVNGEDAEATEKTAKLFELNGGIPSNLSVTDLMGKTKEITYTADGTATGANVLTSGPTIYTPDPTNTAQDVKLVVLSRMYRAFAKVTVSVNSSVNAAKGLFKLISTSPVTISGVPTVTRLYDDGSLQYPDATTPSNFRSDIPISGIALNEKEGTFNMAENIRGTGLATTAQEKNIAAKGPDGSLDGCTYLLVKGQYQYCLGENKYSSPIDVEYKFYLGGDLVTDYNIYRDYHYIMTVNIAGPNSADLRVKITNGNVAVFDDADTITNTVIF